MHTTSDHLSINHLAADPITQFDRWFTQAKQANIPQVNAMVLSTVSSDNSPSQRNVLLKKFDENGFVFFTNHSSRKARDMQENTAVSALFAWHILHRQVIIAGQVSRITDDESAAYFASRPRAAQLGAWASKQSAPLDSRTQLIDRLQRMRDKFADGEIPLPDFWGGYRIDHTRVEFWQGGDHRLHDRIVYTRSGDNWQLTRLYP